MKAKTIDPTRLLEEELVSPSVYSEGGGDRRMDDVNLPVVTVPRSRVATVDPRSHIGRCAGLAAWQLYISIRKPLFLLPSLA